MTRPKVLHGIGFPDLVLYQKDLDTLTIRKEVDGGKRGIECSDAIVDNVYGRITLGSTY